MQTKSRIVLFSILVIFALTIVAVAQEPVHWTYEGEEGPDHWGELSDDFALCSTGRTQSPINIVTVVGTNVGDIAFDYHDSALNILNNGHTVQVNYDAGSSIMYNGTQYDLVQFHFHHPSEHTINGVASPMEVHFVHRSAEGNLAVVGVMLNEGAEDNAAFADVFANLPPEQAEVATMDAVVSAMSMLPEAKTYYTYSGSLTTPPCSEGVRWLLLDHPIELSATQLEAFGSIFENDARPVQPVNARDVIEDSSSDS